MTCTDGNEYEQDELDDGRHHKNAGNIFDDEDPNPHYTQAEHPELVEKKEG